MSQFGMPPSNVIDGFRMPHVFTAESFRSAVRYRPKPDDLFIVTYPKCGTTWAQHILSLIFSHGDPEKASCEGPFLELKGAHAAETLTRHGFIKTHLPFKFAPWSVEAKYIYIARNPKDCCVSYYSTYYHHLSHRFDGNFDDFFEMFFSGDVNFGDYFDHLLGWYEHRNDPNVLFLTYEEMKETPETAVLKMASFIDDEKYAEPLRKDSEKLNNVLKHSSFQYMKDIANKNSEEKPASSVEHSGHSESSDNQTGEIEQKKGHTNKSLSARLVRKGIVGDWRNHFSKEQSERMDQKFSEKTKGTDIVDWWIKCM